MNASLSGQTSYLTFKLSPTVDLRMRIALIAINAILKFQL